jgi:hypothetical protein
VIIIVGAIRCVCSERLLRLRRVRQCKPHPLFVAAARLGPRGEQTDGPRRARHKVGVFLVTDQTRVLATSLASLSAAYLPKESMSLLSATTTYTEMQVTAPALMSGCSGS